MTQAEKATTESAAENKTNLIAIYDMDKTIIRGATFAPFLFFMLRYNAKWRIVFTPFAILALLAYTFHIIDRARLKTWLHQCFIGREISASKFDFFTGLFSHHMMNTMLLKKATDQISKDRRDGYYLIMASASYQAYVEHFAKALGFNAIIATKLRQNQDGKILPQIDGENCYGEAKLRAIKKWFADHEVDYKKIKFRTYSDHISDIPMLSLAGNNAAVVNADTPLLTEAKKRMWKILIWK